jgi:hypothetical protein
MELTPVSKRLVTTKDILIISMIVAGLTILAVWLFGLGQHRSVFENSILSTSILSISFCLFVSIGLYNGIKLKDDLGKVTDKISFEKAPQGTPEFLPEIPDAGDGVEGFLLSLLLWLLFSGLILIVIWFFGAVFWAMLLVFTAMLYWIFFRALRLVFKKSSLCKGQVRKSIQYGIGYTLLYNFWIYAIMLISHYL